MYRARPIFSFILIFGFCAAQYNNSTFAQDSLVGGIDVEQGESQKPMHIMARESVSATFHKIDKELKLKQPSRVPDFSDIDITYLNAVYLYCSRMSGKCPLVLDGILEVDLINSKLAGKTSCLNLKRFWKSWLSTDMEKRLEFDLKVGLFKAAEDFKKNERPKYIKCDQTIEQIVTQGGAGLFESRYKDGSAVREGITKLVNFLDALNKKFPNIFRVVGVRVEG